MAKAVPLYEHQKGDITFETSNDGTFDTSDAGTGKTRTRLEVFSRRRANGSKCALVLAPKSLLRSAWELDCQRFTPWLTAQCCYAETRAKDFAKKADLYITNHDAVKWLAKQPPKFFEKFDCLIIDESTAFKHHTSDRSKSLAKIKKYFKYRVCMTGTPNTNNVTDLWNQVNILDDGKRLGTSFYHFRGSVQQPTQVGPQANMVRWTDKPGAEDAVGSLIHDITIRHAFEDCHDIPENHSYIVPFELDGKHLAAYVEMQETAVAKLNTGDISAINAAAVATKLLQIASGAVYDGNGAYHVVDSSRYELVGQLVSERKNSVVFFLWEHQRDLLIEEFDKRKITWTLIDGSVSSKKRDSAVQDFQHGFKRVLLAHPASAAHGLTLTKGTSTIWASPTYNLEHYLQGNRRIYRAGQTQKTETVNIVATGTIEERVHQILTAKNAKMVNLLDVLR